MHFLTPIASVPYGAATTPHVNRCVGCNLWNSESVRHTAQSVNVIHVCCVLTP